MKNHYFHFYFKPHIVIFLVLFALYICFSFSRWYTEQETPTKEQQLLLDTKGFYPKADSGFYEDGVTIDLAIAPGMSVYYTTDGSIPTSQSTLYTEPLYLESEDETEVFHITFGAKSMSPSSKDESPAQKVYRCTYVLGKHVTERFSTDVVCLSGGAEEIATLLSDVEAKGADSEQPVHVQIFNKEGESLVSSFCGARMFGNFSRNKFQKSIQLFARHAYDTNGSFHLSAFPALRTKTDHTILAKHNRLVLRNSGNDYAKGFLRDTLTEELLTRYGFPAATPYTPVCVYVNGSYYGFMWMKEPFHDKEAERLFGSTESGHFEVVEINDFYKTASCTSPEATSAYEDLYKTFSNADFTDDAVLEAFCKRVDLDNYLTYYATELYIANKDWPYNNMKAYRFVSDTPSDYKEGTILDGRYRYLIYDTDYAYNGHDDVEGYKEWEDNYAVLIGNEQSALFCALMSRPDLRSKFSSITCDLRNAPFSTDSILTAMSDLSAVSDKELTHYIETVSISGEEVSATTIANERATIASFATNRPAYALNFIQRDFAQFYPYQLQITGAEGVQISVNTIPDVGNAFTGIYYADAPLTITASVDPGHTFEGFTIGEKTFSSPSVTLTQEELFSLLSLTDADNIFSDAFASAHPELYTVPDENNVPTYLDMQAASALHILPICVQVSDNPSSTVRISALTARGHEDSVTLTNYAEHALSLQGLFLSDSLEDLQKKALGGDLSAGSSVTLYGGKSSFSGLSSSLNMGFSLHDGETLYLSDSTGNILSQVEIPKLGRKDSSYQLDPFQNIFYEEKEQ